MRIRFSFTIDITRDSRRVHHSAHERPRSLRGWLMSTRMVKATLRATPVPGLCPTCWLPSLVNLSAVWLVPDGVRETTLRTTCTGCPA